MKNALIALATIATLGATAPAFAAGQSAVDRGNQERFNPVPGTLFGGAVDYEATASIGNSNASGVFTETYYDRGAEVRETFTLDADGNKTVISTYRDYNN